MTDQPVPPQWPDNALHIESMDLDAQGVAHRTDGKVVFVDGALPFEVVRANVHRKKKQLGASLVAGGVARILATCAPPLPPLWITCWRMWWLQNATPRTQCASGHQTACVGRQPVAPRQSQTRHPVATHSRPCLGLPFSGTLVGALCAKKKARC